MSCYIRYMKKFLSDRDIKPETKEERKDIDLVIRKVIGKKSTAKCNEVWKEVKVRLDDDKKRHELSSELMKPR